ERAIERITISTVWRNAYGLRVRNGNPLPRAAKGRPDFEKICIRFDDWSGDSGLSPSDVWTFIQ
ncbi:MAG: hypothetical protein OXM60_11075, partial [Defluviicoccus sp.]|nr:hypothetical protein [Defluviicoccus sp.]